MVWQNNWKNVGKWKKNKKKSWNVWKNFIHLIVVLLLQVIQAYESKKQLIKFTFWKFKISSESSKGNWVYHLFRKFSFILNKIEKSSANWVNFKLQKNQPHLPYQIPIPFCLLFGLSIKGSKKLLTKGYPNVCGEGQDSWKPNWNWCMVSLQPKLIKLMSTSDGQQNFELMKIRLSTRLNSTIRNNVTKF